MQLIVRPINATLSHDTQTFSRMDPYVVCVINGQRQKTRVHQQGGKHPKWNDTLTFTVTNFSGMNVQVWDQDMVVDDLVGQGFVDLSAHMSNPGIIRNQNVALTYKGKRAGMVNMSIQVQGGIGGMGMGGGIGMGNMMGNMMMGNAGNMMNNGWGNMGMGNMGGNMNNNGWGQGPYNNNNGWGQSPMNNNGWGQGINNNEWGNQAMGNNGWGGNNNGWGNMGGGIGNNGW